MQKRYILISIAVVSLIAIVAVASPLQWTEHLGKDSVYRLDLGGVAPTTAQYAANNLQIGQRIVDTSTGTIYTMYSTTPSFKTITSAGIVTTPVVVTPAITPVGDLTITPAGGDVVIVGNVEATQMNTRAATVATFGFGMPLVSDANNNYSYLNDFFSAGYKADSGTTNNASTFSETANYAEWLVTVTDSGSDEGETIVIADNSGAGWVTITCNDAVNDAVEIQKNGESFAVTTTKDLWYETKIQIEDVSDDKVTWGLTVSDTDVSGSFGNDFMLFQLDASTNVSFFMGKNGTLSTNLNVAVMADITGSVFASAKTFGIFADGSTSNVYVYIDGVAVATNVASTSLPNDLALSPVYSVVTTNIGADALWIDYLDCKAQR